MGLYNRFGKRFFAAVIIRLTAQSDSRAPAGSLIIIVIDQFGVIDQPHRCTGIIIVRSAPVRWTYQPGHTLPRLPSRPGWTQTVGVRRR